jgi:signal peptidase I
MTLTSSALWQRTKLSLMAIVVHPGAEGHRPLRTLPLVTRVWPNVCLVTPMPQLRRHSQPLFAILASVAIIVMWLLFAPTAIGGQASYIVINGNSMEPGMRRGDLAILRQSTSYAIGDVVTYRHPEIGPVIHRVIGREGERFVFQGDNNDFIDPYRPHGDELIGRLWLFVPRVGTAVIFLRQPPVFAGLAALLIGIATMATGTLPMHSRRRASIPVGPGRGGNQVVLLNSVLTTMLALGLAALGLAGVAFSQPTTRQIEQVVPFTQQVSFDYGAPAPAGLYDGGAARGGDPIFRRLANSVAVTATYTLATETPAQLEGTARLLIELSDGAGWRRSLPLGPEQSFAGARVSLVGTLDLDAIEAALRRYEMQTGTRQASYGVTLTPHYTVRGNLGGAPLDLRYAPQLAFTLDDTRLRLRTDNAAESLNSADTSMLLRQATVPNTLALWLLKLDVLTARRLALVGFELALVGGLLTGWQLSRMLRRDPTAAARLRFGAQLVHAPAGAVWAHDAIGLSSLDDLARVAERCGQPIIVIEGGSAPGFYLRDGAVVYCYCAAPTAEEH